MHSKFKKSILSLGMVLCMSSISVFAVEGNFTTQPDQVVKEALAEVDNTLGDVKAYVTDLNGVVTEVTPINVMLESRLPSGYTYSFSSYSQNLTKKDLKFDHLGTASYENNSSQSESLEYSQGNSIDTTWDVRGEVSGDAEFGTALLGKIKASVGVSVARISRTGSSTTVSATYNVPSGYIGYIDRYKPAYASGGMVTYKRYQNGIFAGYYSEESGNWGWAPATSDTHFVNRKEKI